MKIFKLTNKISAVCEWKNTRNGFKHEATLFLNDVEKETVKICYLNRTWEKYEYESVLLDLIRKTTSLNTEEKATCNKYINEYV